MNDRDDITVETTSIADGVILRPVGDIDLSRAPSLRRAIAEAQAARPARLVIDLSQVPYMDSSGIATLVEALQRARQSKGRIVVACPQQRVRSVFEIAKLDTVFTITTSIDAAVTV